MRRTTANPLALGPLGAPIDLAALTCRLCGAAGITIVAMGRNENGAIERVWCGPVCARIQGWPFLVSERQDDGPTMSQSAVAGVGLLPAAQPRAMDARTDQRPAPPAGGTGIMDTTPCLSPSPHI